jgi:hypothetical protein
MTSPGTRVAPPAPETLRSKHTTSFSALLEQLGVWMVDVCTGRAVAFLRFEDAVQEVFAVQVMPGQRCPEIAPDDDSLLTDSYDLPAAATR